MSCSRDALFPAPTRHTRSGIVTVSRTPSQQPRATAHTDSAHRCGVQCSGHASAHSLYKYISRPVQCAQCPHPQPIPPETSAGGARPGFSFLLVRALVASGASHSLRNGICRHGASTNPTGKERLSEGKSEWMAGLRRNDFIFCTPVHPRRELK
jgi:hypothetical protein